MKVLTVTNMYPTAERPGWGAFVGSQVASLRTAGIETDVLIVDGWRGKLEYARAVFKLRKAVADGEYDLVHAHYGLTGLVARAQTQLPLVVSFCGDDLYGKSDSNGDAKLSSLPLAHLHRRLARVVDGVIVKSEAMRRLLPARAAEAAQVIPNGVDFDRFHPGDRTAARANFDLSPDAKYVLFPYDPSRPRKNVSLVDAAIAQVYQRTGQEVRRLTLFDKPADEIAQAMRAADVLALASFWEGSPNVVKEAMASCLPVVTADVGDVVDTLGDTPGCSVVLRTPTDFADAIIAALEHGVPTDGRARIAHLRADQIAARVISVYGAALGGATQPVAGAA